MKISIITACFNSAATIERTIQSVVNQTYYNIEYILIDGGSTDETLEIAGRYADFITLCVSEKDNGIYDALNKGIQLATGDLIGFLHADDMLASDGIIEKIVSMASSHDVVYGDLDYIRSNGTVLRHWISEPFSFKLLKKGWMPPHPTLYVRKELYKKVGGFNLSYRIASDYDFILRLFSTPNLKAAYLPEVVVLMQVGGVSNRNLKTVLQKSKEDYWALKRNKIGGIYSLIYKNLSKVGQFFVR